MLCMCISGRTTTSAVNPLVPTWDVRGKSGSRDGGTLAEKIPTKSLSRAPQDLFGTNQVEVGDETI